MPVTEQVRNTTRRARRTPDKQFKASASRGVDQVQRGVRVIGRALDSRKNPPTADEREAIQNAVNELKRMMDGLFEQRATTNGAILKWQ